MNTILLSLAAFKTLLLFQQTAESVEQTGAGLTIFLVPFLLALAVIAVVGLPFLMNYRREVRPKEKTDNHKS